MKDFILIAYSKSGYETERSFHYTRKKAEERAKELKENGFAFSFIIKKNQISVRRKK